jgi:cobalt-precorrin-7 (C5)-methyltransferase
MDISTTEFTVVGCGPGAREYLTARATQCIARAELLAGASRLLELFPESRACRLAYSGLAESWLDRLEAMPARPCVILVTGDPGVSSLAEHAHRRFGLRRCRIEPGISTVQVVCAALGVTWQNAAIVDVHHQAPDKPMVPASDRDPWIFLMGARNGETAVSRILSKSGRNAYLAEDLSLASQSLRSTSATELSELPLHPRRIVVATKEALAV